MSVVVELRENDVPYFHEAVALSAHDILRSISEFGTSVIVNLCTGTAGAGAVLPEVILLAEFVDALCRDVHVIEPDIVGLIVFFIYGGIQSVRIETDNLGQEFPRPRNRFFLEVVSEGKVSKHLEVRAVTGGFPDVFQITGTDAFLTGGNSSSRRNLLPGEPGLHRSHAGVDDQKGIVIVRNE